MRKEPEVDDTRAAVSVASPPPATMDPSPYVVRPLALDTVLAREEEIAAHAAHSPRALDADGAVQGRPLHDTDPLQLEPGIEIRMGDHRLRCVHVLGSGSYSVVWRAEVLNSRDYAYPEGRAPGSRMVGEREVALKDVLCRSEAVLRQSLFEVQLLLALERRVLLTNANGHSVRYPLRLPRCFAYKVALCDDGWRVRTAMTRLPGEQLDDWLRRAAIAVTEDLQRPLGPGERRRSWTSQLRRGCKMAEALVRQIGPTLQSLAPLAWHRDVNSHNVLVSTSHEADGPMAYAGSAGQLLCDSPEDSGYGATYWLIDLGLAVDAQSWVSPEGNMQDGAWRVTDIGGDCRYWPASSWMVHLYGADYLVGREDFCRQYQWRLDSFGLGITAVELLCSTALAARLAGAPPEEGGASLNDARWARVLDAWQKYYDRAGTWWEQIYAVFSCGGDFRPVHAWLSEEQVADQVVELMGDLREGLRECMACSDQRTARVLYVLAELIDEASELELEQLCDMLGPAGKESPPEWPRTTGSLTRRSAKADGASEAAAAMRSPRGSSPGTAPPSAAERSPPWSLASGEVERSYQHNGRRSRSQTQAQSWDELEKLQLERLRLREEVEQLQLTKLRLQQLRRGYEDRKMMKAALPVGGGQQLPQQLPPSPQLLPPSQQQLAEGVGGSASEADR